MPGVPKSCGVCQIRKVKCDRAPSGCSQCIKYRWECPGYPKVRRKARKSPSDAASKARLFDAGPRRPSKSISREEVLRDFEAEPVSLWRGISESPLVQDLVGYLSLDVPRSLSLHQVGCFLWFVPSRLGVSQALDDAVECLCAAYASFLSATPSETTVYYTKALSTLQASLRDDEEALSAEVLCASVCLSWYELLVNDVDSTWLTFTSGTTKMIQLRGPEKHADAFGRSLLHAHHGYITCHALIEGKPSFLVDPAWVQTLDTPLPAPRASSDADPLVSHFKRSDTFSLIHQEITDLTPAGGDLARRADDIVQRLDALERAFKANLVTSNCDFPADILDGLSSADKSDPYTAFVICKDALSSVMVHIEWLELSRVLSRMPSLHAEERACLEAFCHQKLTPHEYASSLLYHEVQIKALFSMAERSYPLAVASTPLACRRLVSAYRNVYKQVLTAKSHHPVWEDIMALLGC